MVHHSPLVNPPPQMEVFNELTMSGQLTMSGRENALREDGTSVCFFLFTLFPLRVRKVLVFEKSSGVNTPPQNTTSFGRKNITPGGIVLGGVLTEFPSDTKVSASATIQPQQVLPVQFCKCTPTNLPPDHIWVVKTSFVSSAL